MPITSKYSLYAVIEVGMASFDDLGTTKVKAENFIANQIGAGNIEATSYVKPEYKGDPMSSVPHWLRMELFLDIVDFSVVEAINNALVSALDTFDEVFKFECRPVHRMVEFTSPA